MYLNSSSMARFTANLVKIIIIIFYYYKIIINSLISVPTSVNGWAMADCWNNLTNCWGKEGDGGVRGGGGCKEGGGV